MKYDAKVMFSEFLSFCPQGRGEGGGVKIEKCSECHGKPKKCIKIYFGPYSLWLGGPKANILEVMATSVKIP